MLDFALSASVNEQVWEALPAATKRAFDEQGAYIGHDQRTELHDERRRFRRVSVSGRAVIRTQDQFFGVYLHDVSPMGIGFAAPMQIFPKQVLAISFLESETLLVQLRRCKRLADECYACGTVFAKGSMAPPVYRKLLHSLKS